jgi:tetratricopeptide (TPR) repeat protein
VKIADLRVVSGSSSHRYQNAPKNMVQMAAELGVANVLQGTLQKEGDRFRVAIRLIDAKKNRDLWAQSYDRPFSDILQLEGEVAQKVAGALGMKLSEPEQRAISAIATSNAKAYEAYLKGRYVWLQRTYDGYRQAKEYFNQAIALDPNYARAYAGLADAYQFLAAFSSYGRKENYEKAKDACKRALELDPNLAEAHASVGLIAMNYDWEWALAEQEFRRALALDPNNALIYDWYAEYLMAVGRATESLDRINLARGLDPFSPIINSDAGKMLYYARFYDEAEAQLKETLRMDPDFGHARYWLAQVYATKHRFDEAIAELKIVERSGSGPWEWGLMAYTYGMAGRKAEAEQMLEAMKKRFSRGPQPDMLAMAHAYIGLGDKDRAIACLEQDYDAHATSMTSLKTNPWYDSLRSDPRFVDLIRRVHLSP